MICSNCKEKIRATEQPENSRPFPAFTVVGGVLGAVGTVLTGTILLVPAAVVAGAVADISSQRCELCDNEIEEDQLAYHLMEEFDNTGGGQIYKPVKSSAGQRQANPQQPGLRQSPSSFQPPEKIQETSQTLPTKELQESDEEPQAQCEYVFDQMEGKLVQRDTSPGDDTVNINLAENLDGDIEAGFEVPQTFELDDGADFTNSDYFGEFQDDISIDTEPFGPVDDPPVGGF